MSLYNRLIGTEQPKIPVHQFCAALAERSRLKLTHDDIVQMFTLSTSEAQEAADFYTAVGPLASTEVEDVLVLAEWRLAYATEASIKTRFNVVAL